VPDDTKFLDELALPQALPLQGESTTSNIEQVQTMWKLAQRNRHAKHIN